MNIELKNIQINKSFSEETICFTADIYVNGKKTGYARNDGRGGCTYYSSYHKPNNEHDLRQAEAYAKSLPSRMAKLSDEKEFEILSNLEGLIDEMIEKKFNEGENLAFERKLNKATETAIVWGKPNSGRFTSLGFNGKPKLAEISKTTQGQIAIKNLVEKVKKELKEGEVILNKNILH